MGESHEEAHTKGNHMAESVDKAAHRSAAGLGVLLRAAGSALQWLVEFGSRWQPTPIPPSGIAKNELLVNFAPVHTPVDSAVASRLSIASLDDAAAESNALGRLLFVFLHSDLHPVSERVLQQLLENAEAHKLFQDSYVFFLISSLDIELAGPRPAALMQCQAFPCCAVYGVNPAHRGTQGGIVLLAQLENPSEGTTVVEFAKRCIETYDHDGR